jgi:hypothetical protein
MVVTRASDRTLAPSTVTAPTMSDDPNVVPLWRFPTSGIAFGGGDEGLANGVMPRLPKRDEIVPLTATVRRIHFNVDKQVVRKLKVAREGLSHSIRGATMEQVLEAALDLLLEKQAKARGQVKKPRAVVAAASATPIGIAVETATTGSGPTVSPTPIPTLTPIAIPTVTPTEPPPHRRDGPRAAIPAAVRRAVWDRDGDRCSWPLDGGGCCGSTHRMELDHIIPWAEWGPDTAENLRVVCGRHNALAARQAFGGRQSNRYRRNGG